MFPKKKIRPPVEGLLRRLPGQSVRDERDRILNEHVLDYLVFAFMFCLLAAWEWLRRWLALPRIPEFLTVVAVGVAAYCGFRIFRFRKEIRNLNQAEKGERRIAELLRQLRRRDYVAFDDLLVRNANIDHVLVGPGGIFAIETKAYWIFGDGRVGVDESGVLRLSGKPAFKDPLRQATLAAQAVAKVLQDRMQKQYDVTPVLVFPGWKLRGARRETGVIVLTDAIIAEFFEGRSRLLANQDVSSICSHLDQVARG